MQTRNLLLPVIVSLLLLTACGGEQQGGPVVDPFIGGNLGVNLYLQDGAPPPAVYDGGNFPFSVNIVVENVGESDIGPGTDNPYMTMRIEGINPQNFGLTEADMVQTLQDPLRGAQKNFDGTIIGGLVTNFVFDNLNYQGRRQGNDLFTIRGTACYDYTTEVTTQLCFKNEIVENVQDNSICTLVGDRPFHNSGAPVHVVGVTQSPMTDNKILVNFVIDHVGPGEFYGRTPEETCDPSFTNNNKFKVEVEVNMQDPSATVTCGRLSSSNKGTVTLFAGSPQTVTCTVTGGSTGTRVYTDSMDISLKYRYEQFIEQPVIIQAVPQEG